ncbi:MAG: DUF5343 domain-containing protein [bacterium]|nr:DUF5343 domain-containing protein [bacterium]
MASTTKRKPPYISEAIWTQFFEQLKRKNIPPSFKTDDIKGWGIASGQVHHLFSALIYLELVEPDGTTTDKMRSLAGVGESRAKNLGHIIDEAYSGLLAQLKIEEATYEDLKNYFAHHHSNASAAKMVRSFLTLARFASWDFPFMAEARQARSVGVPRKKTEKKARPKPPPPPPEKTKVAAFDPIELAKAMGDWDVQKMKVFFEELGKLKEEK